MKKLIMFEKWEFIGVLVGDYVCTSQNKSAGWKQWLENIAFHAKYEK